MTRWAGAAEDVSAGEICDAIAIASEMLQRARRATQSAPKRRKAGK